MLERTCEERQRDGPAGCHDGDMTHPHARPNPVYFGFAEPEPHLYEFRTDTGVYVFLHELECVEVAYLPLTRTLTITFEGGPTDLVSAMTVTLTFAEAEIYRWEAIGEPVAHEVVEKHRRVRGQVSDFSTSRGVPGSASTGVSFHLSLLDVAASFFAASVGCEVRQVASGSE